MRLSFIAPIIILLTGLTVNCGGGGSSSAPPPQPNTIAISPSSPSVHAGASQQFTATVTGAASPALTWSVNGVPNGNSTVGTVQTTGTSTATALYTAPTKLPTPNTVTIEAAMTTDATVNGNTPVTLLNPVPQISSVSPSLINVGPFALTVWGSGFVNGAVVSFGSTALPTTFVSSTELTATGTAVSSQIGAVTIAVTNPDPGSSASGNYIAHVATGALVSPQMAARFLEQTTFGPTIPSIADVQATGMQGFVTNQFNLPVSPYADPDVGETGLSALQKRFFVQILYAPDQLRQRVAFALGQIFVIAGDKINTPQAFTPYLRLLEADSFTNYRQIMEDVTLSPAMGHYLDMVNNDKPDPALGNHANENYARELMQIFTIGTSLLNEDGSLQLDASGNPIPTYTQDTVEAFARAYTGWTYPTQPGATPQKHNPAYWNGPMVADDANHDTAAKQLLQYAGAAGGGLEPAGQSAALDLEGALDNIFNHPNVPPFVSRRLIQHLVTSNPSPAYVQRVADVFKDNGMGVRGDMKAIITAILLDPEARRGDDPTMAGPNDGHLQEPILFMAGLLRAFDATSDGSNLAGQGSAMSQNALFPASVFNFFSPNYVITGSHLLGPEFQILTTATALSRANWVNSFVFGSLGPGTTVSFSSYASQASTPGALLDNLATLLLHGAMPSDMKASILTAMQAVPAGPTQSLLQAKTAIYLIATSSQYQVQH